MPDTTCTPLFKILNLPMHKTDIDIYLIIVTPCSRPYKYVFMAHSRAMLRQCAHAVHALVPKLEALLS